VFIAKGVGFRKEGFGKPYMEVARSRLRACVHTLEFDPFINSQFELCNLLWDFMQYKFGHVPTRISAPSKPMWPTVWYGFTTTSQPNRLGHVSAIKYCVAFLTDCVEG